MNDRVRKLHKALMEYAEWNCPDACTDDCPYFQHFHFSNCVLVGFTNLVLETEGEKMKYTKERFKSLVQSMVDTYGVDSYLNNIIPEMSDEEIDADLWFACPECGEPILYEDWDMSYYIDGDEWQCPVCEEIMELQL